MSRKEEEIKISKNRETKVPQAVQEGLIERIHKELTWNFYFLVHLRILHYLWLSRQLSTTDNASRPLEGYTN